MEHTLKENKSEKDNKSKEAKAESLSKIRQLIANQLHKDSFDSNTWLLLGTLGCHLCDIAENTVNSFALVHPIKTMKIDIVDLDEALMSKFSDIIPVVLTPNSQINYPFSIVDLCEYHSHITNL